MQFLLKDLDPDSSVRDERFPKDFLIEVMALMLYLYKKK